MYELDQYLESRFKAQEELQRNRRAFVMVSWLAAMQTAAIIVLLVLLWMR